MHTLTLDTLAGIRVDVDAPGPHGDAAGYGTHATRYRVKLDDGRWRRVYVDVLGNGGAAYVRRAGHDHYLSPEVETALDGAATLDDVQDVDDIRATLAELGAYDVERWRLIRLLGRSLML